MNDLYWLRIIFFGHEVQFMDLISHRKNLNENFQAIWLACILSIWKHCNFVLFDNQDCLARTPLDMVQILVWSWIKSKAKDF